MKSFDKKKIRFLIELNCRERTYYTVCGVLVSEPETTKGLFLYGMVGSKIKILWDEISHNKESRNWDMVKRHSAQLVEYLNLRLQNCLCVEILT